MRTQTAAADKLDYMFERKRGDHAAQRTQSAAVLAPQDHARARLPQCPALQAQVRRGWRQARRSQIARRSRALSLHGEDRPARQLSIRHVRRAARAAPARARILWHHRQADRGRLYQAGPRYLGRPDGALFCLRRHAARRHRAQRLRLRPVHRRSWRALRRRAARLHRGPHLGRRHRTAGDADR